MRSRRAWVLLCILGGALLLLTLAGLLLDLPGSAGRVRIARVNILVGLLVAASAAYFAAVRLILRHAWPRRTLWLVLAVGVGLRALLLTEPPLLSSDIYRYVWDGRVQAASINPYRYVPADPALAFLRDDAVYPNINRKTYARTIYPPFAQLVFAAVGYGRGGVLAMRLTMLAFEALGVASLLLLLARAGLPRERILIYLWNPLALWSFASDGHVDAIVVGVLGLAMLLQARRRDGWAGATLALAVLVKFIPLLVAPAFLRSGSGSGSVWRPALAGCAVVVGLYALYAGAGWHVLGFLPSYGSEEGIDSGYGFWLLAGISQLVILPSGAMLAYIAGAGGIYAALAVSILRQRPSGSDPVVLGRDVATLAAFVTVAASPHYHWYFAWLALPAVLAPSRGLLWLATMPLLLIDEPIPGDRFFWPSLVYLPALALHLADLRRSRAPVPRPMPV